MPDLIIASDSEDYLTPEADDAELWFADALRERGLRGSFQLVGELVRTLQRRGREDVLDALAHHEIGYHSDTHSLPPTHPEALEGVDLAAGIAHVLQREAPGLATLAQRFGRWPVSYCAPGDSWTPATLLAMARMGISVLCNDRVNAGDVGPYWYCGLLTAGYHLDLQDCFEDRLDFHRELDRLVDESGDDGVVVLFLHPCRIVTDAFWDEAFRGGRRRAIADCPPAPLRPAAEVERIKGRLAGWLDHLAARDDLRSIDYATLYRQQTGHRRTLDRLRDEHRLAPGEEGRLPLRRGDDGYIASRSFDRKRFDWVPYPADFTGQGLIAQAAELAWTTAPANPSIPAELIEGIR